MSNSHDYLGVATCITAIGFVAICFYNPTPSKNVEKPASTECEEVIYSTPVPKRIALYSSNGNIIQVWTSQGVIKQKGSRYDFMDKDTGKAVSVTVGDGSRALTVVDLQ